MRSSLVAKGEFAYGLKKVKKKDAKSPIGYWDSVGLPQSRRSDVRPWELGWSVGVKKFCYDRML